MGDGLDGCGNGGVWMGILSGLLREEGDVVGKERGRTVHLICVLGK